ncbi:MAG: hypothetical protein ABI622_01875 [Chloroflexota bacterium]
MSVVGGLTLMGFLMRLPTLWQPLVEIHPWRQTQTAYTSLLYFRDGIDLLHPKLPVLGPPFEVPHEFPLFEALATIPMELGLGPDTSVRLVGLMTFLATGVLLFVFMREMRIDFLGAAMALAAFLFSPFALLWGRTAIIEYLATAGCLGYVILSLRWQSSGRPLWLAAAGIAGVLAMMVKPTTGGLYLLLPVVGWPHATSRRWVAGGAVAAIALLAGFTWTAYADAIKAGSPFTTDITTSAISKEYALFVPNFDGQKWFEIAHRVQLLLAGQGLFIWLGLAGHALTHSEARRVWALLFLMVIGSFFALLSYVFAHEYSLAAIAPVIAAVVGVGSSHLWQHRHRLVARGLAVALLAAWMVSIGSTVNYWGRAYVSPVPDPDQVLPVARFLRTDVPAAEPVAVVGRGWSPAILYYADRVGFMLQTESSLAAALSYLRGARYTVIFRCPVKSPRCEVWRHLR